MKIRVLLTGAASLVGAEILRTLLRRADVESILLLASWAAPGGKRDLERLESYLGPLPPAVKPLAGNLRLTRFGLSPEDWEELVFSIDVGFHCAQREVMDQDFELANQANVRPLDTWIQLLGRNPEVRLHHLSTGCIGGTRRGLLTEFDLNCGQGFHNAWEQSKFDAEVLLRESRVSDRVTIYRPAHVLGQAATGDAFELGGGYPLMAMLARAAVVPADAQARIDIVPADFVAAAMVKLASAGAAGTYHLACGWHHSLPVNQVAAMVAQGAGRSRKALLVPGGIAWPLRATGIAAAGNLYPRSLSFTTAKHMLHQGPVIDTCMTDSSLADLSSTAFASACPPPEGWLETAMVRAKERAWAAPPESEFDTSIEQATLPLAAAEFTSLQENPIFREKHFQRIGNVNIAYRDMGQGEPVVFLHGLAGAHSWDSVIQRLSSTYRTIVIETLGLGDTEGSNAADFQLSAQAAQVRGLLSALEITAAHIVGNDIGGVIAQIFAVRWPHCCKSLVLSNCNAEKTVARWRPISAFMGLPVAAEILPALMKVPWIARSRFGFGQLVHDKRLLTRERLAFYSAMLAANPERRLRLKQFFRSLAQTKITHLDRQIRELDVPALIIWGAEDDYLSASWAKSLYDAMPGAKRLELIPFAGLSCHEERPDIFAQLAAGFFNEIKEPDIAQAPPSVSTHRNTRATSLSIC